MKKLWLAISLFCGMQYLATAAEIEQWEVLDIAIAAKVDEVNPFVVSAIAQFSHSSGQKQTVPLFYNGNNQWIIRFSSGLKGNWSYQTSSAVAGLSNHKGKIRVLDNSDPANHGAMVIKADNSQFFSYEDGSPYFLLGYELDWLFALDYHNDKSLPKTEHLLSLIKTAGFNHIVMNVFAYDVSWQKDPLLAQHPEHEFGGQQDIYPFLGSNDKPDFSQLNIEFFQKLDRTIQLMHDKRMVSHLMIYVWNKLVNWPDMNSAADNMYFDYVIKRYSAYPNIVWDISKEALYYGRADEAYIKGRIERLRALNHFKRLVTVHDFGYCAKYPEQVDFISTQDWGSDLYSKMLNVRKRFPDKPIYNIEHGGYEQSPYEVFPGDYTDPEVSVRRNWMSVFAGVYSTYYWQANAWNVIIYNPFEQTDDFIQPRFDYFKSFKRLFSRYDYAQFRPEPNKNGSGYNLTNEAGTHLIYVPKDNFQMSRGNYYLYPKEDLQRNFAWLNTLTGEMSEFKIIEKGQLFISPWRGQADAILISEIISQEE